MPSKQFLFNKRKKRNRIRLKKHSSDRLRLSVYRSNCHFYAQLIDDDKHSTICSASTLEGESTEKLSGLEAAKAVGKQFASKAKEKGISKIVFDRGGYAYHGQVKAFAETLREEGLDF